MSTSELSCAANDQKLGDALPLEASLPASVDLAQAVEQSNRTKVLWLSFTGFTLSFAAWLMFGVLGIPIQKEFQFNDVSLAWLSAIAILNGALWRLPFGMLADRVGGKRTFIGLLLFASISSFLVATSQSYGELMVFAFLVGLGGNSFSVGSAWNAAWFPPKQQGFAMGLFGAGNVGASVTKLIGPVLIGLVPVAGMLGGWIPGGWRFVPFLYGCLLVLMAIVVALMAPATDKKPAAGRSLKVMLAPLREIRVWRFSLYYTVFFGTFVALSAWLPKYFVSVYNLPLATAALLTTPFIFASSLMRPFGGWLSDQLGSRQVTYGALIVSSLTTILLSVPLNLTMFTVCVGVLGVTLGIGMASTIKYIPAYYPKDVGAVVGLVGSLAALGGFVMPPLFAYLKEWTGKPQSMFWVVFGLTVISLVWLHCVVLRIRRDETQTI